ncbi:MAG TPA: DUF4179 domain-containing protein [Bacillota bacterium]|jgi:type II secretory pathway component PulF|nr:DUF4179 domain-containing protein [Fastidiosipila sp.]HPX92704.1 DUF4179 domain-containing protein [Bacillota bacterium]HQB80601.1 DUF4179 domain-containing protein [Bacillota bacterium]
MRSTEERLAAVRQRAQEIEVNRSKRRGLVIGVSALAAGLLAVTGLSFLIPSLKAGSPAADYNHPGATASVFDVNNRLGYVLIGVLAFALGVVITILCYRIRMKNKKEQGGSNGRTA